MDVGLFIPCYIDQFYPDVGMATLELLEQFGCAVDFPRAQTCCGQPMANTGCLDDTAPVARNFVKTFAGYDYVVAPSGSCVAMVTHHYDPFFSPNDSAFAALKRNTFELTQFLVDVLHVDSLDVSFPYRVGLHNSCHGLRELRLGSSTERIQPGFNKARQLLELCRDIELVDLERSDECCGFGGTFAITEEAVSCMMGLDRIHDHEQAGAQVITAGDMSCLMHLQGLLRRQQKRLEVMHIAQILTGREPAVSHRAPDSEASAASSSAS